MAATERLNVVAAAHARLANHLRTGDWAADATCGNGHDTLALARLVGPEGRVFACDVLAAALTATRARLRAAGIGDACVSLGQANHAMPDTWLPLEARGRLRAVIFNLGYLPGGDHQATTRTVTTLAALESLAADWLAAGAALAVVCYPGHLEGAREAEAVAAWIATRQEMWVHQETLRAAGTLRPSPVLHWLVKT